jgi:hypothetical protein
MASRERPRPYDPSQARDLLRRLEPQLEALFRKYGISVGQAEQMVCESLVVLGVRRAEVGDPDSWLLDAIQGRCERLIEKELEASDGPPN